MLVFQCLLFSAELFFHSLLAPHRNLFCIHLLPKKKAISSFKQRNNILKLHDFCIVKNWPLEELQRIFFIFLFLLFYLSFLRVKFKLSLKEVLM